MNRLKSGYILGLRKTLALGVAVGLLMPMLLVPVVHAQEPAELTPGAAIVSPEIQARIEKMEQQVASLYKLLLVKEQQLVKARAEAKSCGFMGSVLFTLGGWVAGVGSLFFWDRWRRRNKANMAPTETIDAYLQQIQDRNAKPVTLAATETEFDYQLDLDSPIPESLENDYADLGDEELGDNDTIETKIDLIKAYIDMGETAAAKEIIREVLAKGSEAQQAIAKGLLDELG